MARKQSPGSSVKRKGETGNGPLRPSARLSVTKTPVPRALPVLILRSAVLYPLNTIAIQIGSEENLALLKEYTEEGALAALVVETGEGVQKGRIGVMARMTDRINMPGDTIQVTLHGLRRITLGETIKTSPFLVANTVAAKETGTETIEQNLVIDGNVARILQAAGDLSSLVARVGTHVGDTLRMNVSEPGRFADLAATSLNMSLEDREHVLQSLDIGKRLNFVLGRLEEEVARARVAEDVKSQAEENIGAHNREFFLRAQLRAIQAELGETDTADRESVEILKKIETSGLSEAAAVEARREAGRLRMLSNASSEYQVVRNYLDWLTSMPWQKMSADDTRDIDLDEVGKSLDSAHYGLEKAKERIVEFLAVRKLKGSGSQGPILCLAGPPGTGKTSLGQSIAASIGRKFYRVSVGGVSDEAEIRGHRRTYIGAMPGIFIQALRRVDVRDPLFMIDEIDKMGSSQRKGETTSAMLEVLDPAQNDKFTDHYLGVPFDLSACMFICTANNIFDIPEPLRDRMEIIRISGYTVEEKVEIAWRYSVPKLLAEHGLTTEDIQFTDEVLAFVSGRYSREAGIRNFERDLAAVMRRRARKKADGEQGAWIVDNAMVVDALGNPRVTPEAAEQEDEAGVVTGLAWTSTGGDILLVEALRMKGTGKLMVTGQLGSVMRESVDAAHSYVRSRAEAIGIPDDAFDKFDVHVHFPAGAIPKDGPSAGAALTLAIASILSGRKVRRSAAITGEVTLRGRILEIGAVKEKTLAAYRAGIRHVVLPSANEKDLRDLTEIVRAEMRFTFVSTMDEVLDLLLLPATNSPDLPLKTGAGGISGEQDTPTGQ